MKKIIKKSMWKCVVIDGALKILFSFNIIYFLWSLILVFESLGGKKKVETTTIERKGTTNNV